MTLKKVWGPDIVLRNTLYIYTQVKHFESSPKSLHDACIRVKRAVIIANLVTCSKTNIIPKLNSLIRSSTAQDNSFKDNSVCETNTRKIWL